MHMCLFSLHIHERICKTKENYLPVVPVLVVCTKTMLYPLNVASVSLKLDMVFCSSLYIGFFF